jgi:hypothetical protein
MMVRFEIQGVPELTRSLLGLKRDLQKKAIRGSLRKAMRPVLKKAQFNARTLVGGEMGNLIADKMILRPFKKQKRFSYGMSAMLEPGVDEFVHVAKRSRYAGGKTYIPSAIEYGHLLAGRALWMAGPGAASTFVPGIPFMHLAAQEMLPKVTPVFVAEVKKRIEKILAHNRGKSVYQKRFVSGMKRHYKKTHGAA